MGNMPRKFIIAGRVQAGPFQPKKWMLFRYVYRDSDGTLYTKPDYPLPPVMKPNDPGNAPHERD